MFHDMDGDGYRHNGYCDFDYFCSVFGNGGIPARGASMWKLAKAIRCFSLNLYFKYLPIKGKLNLKIKNITRAREDEGHTEILSHTEITETTESCARIGVYR